MRKTAVIMSRVSSDDQVRGYSLDVQFEQLTKYCQRHDIEILKHYREDHSAKTSIDLSFKNSWNTLNSTKIKLIIYL